MAEQENVTGLESLRLKERLLVSPDDAGALQFFAVLKEGKAARKKALAFALN